VALTAEVSFRKAAILPRVTMGAVSPMSLWRLTQGVERRALEAEAAEVEPPGSAAYGEGSRTGHQRRGSQGVPTSGNVSLPHLPEATPPTSPPEGRSSRLAPGTTTRFIRSIPRQTLGALPAKPRPPHLLI